jgi:plastocyanin
VRLQLLIPAFFLVCQTAYAADLSVTVRSAAGAPIADAVVTVSGDQRQPAEFGQPLRISQKDIQFHPFVLVVPKGATVSFPNLDKTRHHVYSFSKAGPFELKLYAAGETRSVRFDKLGTIAIGCNIHDQMSAFIRVVDAPYAAVTDEKGVATLRDVANGARTLTVWHPLQKGPPESVMTRPVAVGPGAASISVQMEVRRPLVSHAHY